MFKTLPRTLAQVFTVCELRPFDELVRPVAIANVLPLEDVIEVTGGRLFYTS
ncbi:hypothetical protein HOLleu_04337 [Holothuria leucospilota]|uniref:Uncharacterized protein n=1 Tax=Holothuria leucospilota TaxID=206669 RepID=A0A9Q1CTX1_HOLLE|nr:hypothetical protein HOLleu_04337 [Holothuria leucospilota]